MRIKKQLLSLIIAGLLAFGAAAPVLALENGSTLTAEERAALKQQRIDAIKQKNAVRKAQIKQEVCEQKTQILNDRIDHLTQQVQKHKDVFDKIYNRVTEFYSSQTATIANADELKAAVEDKKLAAETSIEALKSFQFDVDCNNPSIGEQLANFKEAVKEARDALKAYRKAIVDFVKAIHEATNTADTNEGGETNE